MNDKHNTWHPNTCTISSFSSFSSSSSSLFITTTLTCVHTYTQSTHLRLWMISPATRFTSSNSSIRVVVWVVYSVAREKMMDFRPNHHHHHHVLLRFGFSLSLSLSRCDLFLPIAQCVWMDGWMALLVLYDSHACVVCIPLLVCIPEQSIDDLFMCLSLYVQQ